MAGTLRGLGCVEGLEREVDRARQLRHRLHHFLGRRRIGIVYVQHGDVRNVEALRLVVELGIEQILAQGATDGPGEQVADLGGKRVDETEGALVLAKFLRRKRAIVDRALRECRSLKDEKAGTGNCGDADAGCQHEGPLIFYRQSCGAVAPSNQARQQRRRKVAGFPCAAFSRRKISGTV